VVSTFCDRALLLAGGRFVLEGGPDHVAAAYVARLTHERPGAEW
jgi:hypothetical protein